VYYGIDNIALFETSIPQCCKMFCRPDPMTASCGTVARYSPTDHVHQNTRGASMIADLVEEHIGAAQPDIVGA